MNSKNNAYFTYHNYLQKLQDENSIADTEYIQQMLLQYKQLSALSIIIPNTPVLFVTDYSKRKYLFFSSPFAGYKTQQIMEGGLDFILPLIQPDFLKIFNEKVFPAILSFFKNIPHIQHSDYITSFNYKLKDKRQKEVAVFQRCSYITSPTTGMPTHCIGMVLDMSLFRNEDIITLSFEKVDKATGLISLVEQHVFCPYAEIGFLTEHEKAILHYMADGLNSKMIAQKLDLSTKTINNHRAHMLRKTNTKNVVELVILAVRNKVL